MNEREIRDFMAGVSAEVDATLRGEPTRRDFITRFGTMLGMIPLAGGLLSSVSSRALAQADAEMADPSTPLGQAQAAAWAASTEGPKDGSAYRAAEAAKAFPGVTLSLTYEAGLQGLDPRNFSGPMWEKLTGIKTNVVELAWPDLFSKAVAEHIAGSGAYDVLDVAPMWTPSLADGGVIQPLDDYIAKYMNPADLDDYHPLYKALPTYKGKVWGFFDDGDIFALYYRKDIFEDPKLMEAYKAKFGAPLAPPKTWPE
jgi:multiple sugar transport system substrate-binding protein